MPIVFSYTKPYPLATKKVEDEILEKYKEVLSVFPDEQMYFNWNGDYWSVVVSDSVRHLMNVLDNQEGGKSLE